MFPVELIISLCLGFECVQILHYLISLLPATAIRINSVTTTSKAVTHSGLSTHHQLQLINPPSLSPTNKTVNNVDNPAPPPLCTESILLLLIFCPPFLPKPHSLTNFCILASSFKSCINLSTSLSLVLDPLKHLNSSMSVGISFFLFIIFHTLPLNVLFLSLQNS